MLKSISPHLSADILHALRAMGHGDCIVICDTNFPADSVARHTTVGKPLPMGGTTAAQAADAVLSLLPLDTFVDAPAECMAVVDSPDEVLPVQVEVQAVIDHYQTAPTPLNPLERFAFYEQAKNAYAVIVSGERRFYGCFIFKKGVIPPDAN